MRQSETEGGASGNTLLTALIQLYRGELGRSDHWRSRLDTTTNWALTTTAAVISFSFGSPSVPHVTILVGLWMVLTFLYIETRRYRYYDLWFRRVRLLEDGMWAPLLRNEPFDADALRELASELERPQIQLSLVSAMQTRLSRAYGSLFSILLLSWFGKIAMHPTPTHSLSTLLQRAQIGFIPGWAVAGILLASTLGFGILFVAGRLGKPPLGELRVRPRSFQRSIWHGLSSPYGPSSRRPS